MRLPVKKLLIAVFALALFTPSLTAQNKKVLSLADYGPWKRITSAVMSDDGRWVSYTYSPNDGDDTMVVKQFDGATSYTISSGSGGGARGGGRGGGGGGVQFAPDSRFAAYFVNPPSPSSRGRGAAGAPGRAGAAGAAGAQVRRLEILDLTSGAKYALPNASGFQFSKDSQWLAVKMNGTPGAAHRGTDLILRKLSTGVNQIIGNVFQYAFDSTGRTLAYTIDAAG
jgi:hypothetical protein